MSNYLMVPVRVDALVVKGEELTVAEQMADFSSLPYFDRIMQREFNSETANISESIVSQVFQNQNLRLKHGVHLHWALPDALTRGKSGLSFPAVPNRWLITRRQNGAVDKQWIVESDYLYPPGVNKRGVSVNIPFTSDRWTAGSIGGEYVYSPDRDEEKDLARAGQSYRYMGRKMPLSAWKSQFSEAEYYPHLTAIGYGEPAFAAFYPNCFSVFGFQDHNPIAPLTDSQYEIAGWYSNQENDVLCQLLKENSGDYEAAIKENFNWQVTGNAGPKPDLLICYGGLCFEKEQGELNSEKEQDVKITLANTHTEALSACLANQLAGDPSSLKMIENQLEAVQVAFRLDEKKLDAGARFKELRHENGFSPVPGGTIWVVRKSGDQAPLTGQEPAGEQIVAELPPAIGESLDQVNQLQKEYDQAGFEIAHLRRQLFADWYKYMICLYPADSTIYDYPSPDLVKYFIESKDILPLTEKIARQGKLESVQKDNLGNISGIKASSDSLSHSRAVNLAAKINTLIQDIETAEDMINQENKTAYNYYLEQIPAPRYWQPNNPVVLIEGEGVHPTLRHGQDGILECQLFKPAAGALFQASHDFTELTAYINSLLTRENFGLNTWEKQPWNPIILEWQTQFYPFMTESNHRGHDSRYSPYFITDNYETVVQNPDLELKRDRGQITRAGKIYSGNSILSSQANHYLLKLIENHLIQQQQLLTRYCEKNDSSVLPADRNAAYLKSHISPIKDWYARQNSSSFQDPIYTLLCAYEKLSSMHVLSQALNGFNQALLMLKQTLELSIADPINFAEYIAFSDHTVDQIMSDQIKAAPAPLYSFNPIRSGCLKLVRLQLLDTFGQVKTLSTDHINTTYSMTRAPDSNLIILPPRLTQPARLNFRWLQADENFKETSSFQHTTPVCGWLVTSHLDKSLFFYSASGKALGYFKAGRWHEAIDSDQAVPMEEIANPHLRRVARFVQQCIQANENKELFLEHFINTIDDALENINPEKNSFLQGPALLMGRPVAVVRTMLNLELCGPPAVNQDWNIFRQDMKKNKRTTDNLTQVQFPVRLGEYGQLNDGLVGYWLEKTDDQGSIRFALEEMDEQGKIVFKENNKFYSPQSDYIDTLAIESRYDSLEDGPINFYQSIDDPPQTVTLLMDVQGTLHATVGALPNKEIFIPETLYADALQNIEVSFLNAPLVTQENKINLPLQSYSDYQWSWVEQEKENGQTVWKELFPENRIQKELFVSQWNAAFKTSRAAHLWDYLMRAEIQWLAPVDDNHDLTLDQGWAKIVSQDKRKSPSFSTDFAGQERAVEYMLDRYSVGIDPVTTQAFFSGRQEIKEGWLKLRKK